jgi:hypothetical protein
MKNINSKFDNDLWKIAYEGNKFYIDKDIIYSRLEFQLAEPLNIQLNKNFIWNTETF